MTEYQLYVESGPKMKTTMVHVPELLGCIANARMTEAALEATPGEIRQFLGFLKRHGEDVDPEAEFTTMIAQHVMEGPWIGYGDPAPGFEFDFAPLGREELAKHARRLQWLGADLAAVAGQLGANELDAKPETGRPIREIVHHIAEAEPEYGRTGGIGKPEGVRDIIRAIQGGSDLVTDMRRLFDAVAGQFESATDEMLTQTIQRGQSPYTARRGLRRALEHPWEHLREIEQRVESDKVIEAASRSQ